jgi:hypothetical protein
MLESKEVWAQQRSPNSSPATHPDGRSEVMLRTPNIARTCLWSERHEKKGLRRHDIQSQAHDNMTTLRPNLDLEPLERHAPLVCDGWCFAVAGSTGLRVNGCGPCLTVAGIDGAHGHAEFIWGSHNWFDRNV